MFYVCISKTCTVSNSSESWEIPTIKYLLSTSINIIYNNFICPQWGYFLPSSEEHTFIQHGSHIKHKIRTLNTEQRC